MLIMVLVIFIGLQASGKSTFFRTHFAETHAYVSKDLLRSSKMMNKSAKQNKLVEDALQMRQSVVIDNTNSSREDRELLIRLGHLYGARVIGYYFEASVRECLERNKERVGKARVPDVAIYITSKKMMLPSYEEGFDTLFRVHIKGNGTFDVLDWNTI